MQWDGKHLAIGDTGASPSVIYQFDVSGNSATKVGAATVMGSMMVEQFWIQGGKVIAPDPKRSCGGSRVGCIAIYPYPAGGSAVKAIALASAFGAAVRASYRDAAVRFYFAGLTATPRTPPVIPSVIRTVGWVAPGGKTTTLPFAPAYSSPTKSVPSAP